MSLVDVNVDDDVAVDVDVDDDVAVDWPDPESVRPNENQVSFQSLRFKKPNFEKNFRASKKKLF